MLQAASVIGRAFWSGPTLELVDSEPAAWTLLEDRDFVRRRPSSAIAGEAEYAFKHPLTREVVYASVPKARRAQLHAPFAAWLDAPAAAATRTPPCSHTTPGKRPTPPTPISPGRPSRRSSSGFARERWPGCAARPALAISRYDLDEGSPSCSVRSSSASRTSARSSGARSAERARSSSTASASGRR